MKNGLFFIVLFGIISSCGMNMGDRVDQGNLSVYFLENISKEEAIKFSKYWTNNGCIGERKQVIQLDKEKDIVLVKLIEREQFLNEGITINEEALLQQLERDLQREVFQQRTEIVITDNTFRPILKRE